MKFEFKMGIIITSFLLVNIHMFILTLMLLGGHIIEDLYYILNVAGIAYAAITVLAHIRASWTCMGQMHDPYLLGKPLDDPQSFKEAIDIRRSPVTLGVIWRFKKEWEYIKKTANFDFRFE